MLVYYLNMTATTKLKQVHSASGQPVFAQADGSQKWFPVYGIRQGANSLEVKKENGRYAAVAQVTLDFLELLRMVRAKGGR